MPSPHFFPRIARFLQRNPRSLRTPTKDDAPTPDSGWREARRATRLASAEGKSSFPGVARSRIVPRTGRQACIGGRRPRGIEATPVIRSKKAQRSLSWLGLFAIALVAFAPTVSRVRSCLGHDVMAATLVDAAGHHRISGEAPINGDHHRRGGAPDDCWSKCGYCNFLGHAPAIGSVDYVAAFINAHASATPVRVASGKPYPQYAQAAQPRGPPRLV